MTCTVAIHQHLHTQSRQLDNEKPVTECYCFIIHHATIVLNIVSISTAHRIQNTQVKCMLEKDPPTIRKPILIPGSARLGNDCQKIRVV